MAAYLGHERRYLVFIHIDFLYLVDGTEELLGANLLWSRQITIDKLLAYLLFHGTNLMLLTSVNDSDRGAFLARSASTSRAMGVGFYIVRHAIVDDMSKVIDVKSTRSHVSSHENLNHVLTEFLHSEVSLLLREVAVERICIISVADQMVSHLLSLQFGAAEHDGVDAWVEIHYTLERKVFILGIDEIIDMIDVFRALIARAYHNFLIVTQILFGHSLHFA